MLRTEKFNADLVESKRVITNNSIISYVSEMNYLSHPIYRAIKKDFTTFRFL